MSWYPNTPGSNFRRTHKRLEAAAAADSQVDHHSPPGTPVEAAEGNNLDQAVALLTDILIIETETIITSKETRTLRGIMLLLLLTVVIFVGHEDSGEGKRGAPDCRVSGLIKETPTVRCCADSDDVPRAAPLVAQCGSSYGRSYLSLYTCSRLQCTSNQRTTSLRLLFVLAVATR